MDIPKIPTTHKPTSILEAAFHSFARKEITKQEYEIHCCTWCAQNLNQYQPVQFPFLDNELAQYIDARLAERAPKDKRIGRKLGLWAHEANKTLGENKSTYELLLWSIEKLQAVGLTEYAKKIDEHSKRFLNIKAPMLSILNAQRAQQRDSREYEN
jgi:hypothetical protein